MKEPADASKVTQYYAAIVVSLGGFALGSSMGWSSVAEVHIQSSLNLPLEQVGWIGSMLLLGGATNTFPLPYLLKHYGRKWVMLAATVPLVCAWVTICIATQVQHPTIAMVLFCCGQFVAGICEVTFCVAAPIFIGEIAQKEVRGKMGAFFSLFFTIGTFFSYVVGSYTTVLGLSIACGVVPIIIGVLLIRIPETPSYLIKTNDLSAAEKSLQWFRGTAYDISSEMDELQKDGSSDTDEKFSFKQNLAKPGVKKSLAIGLGAILCQIFSGIDGVGFHLKTIFEMSESTISSNSSLMIIGSLQILATLAATLTVDRVGRKNILFVSMVIVCVCHIVLGTYFLFSDKDELSVQSFGYIPLIVLCIYFLAYSFGAGSIPSIIIGEIFPCNIRNIAVPMCMFINWMSAFLVAVTFHFVVQSIGSSGPFWIYAALCVVAGTIVLSVFVETKGRTLQEIQNILSR